MSGEQSSPTVVPAAGEGTHGADPYKSAFMVESPGYYYGVIYKAPTAFHPGTLVAIQADNRNMAAERLRAIYNEDGWYGSRSLKPLDEALSHESTRETDRLRRYLKYPLSATTPAYY